jgi:thioredoxin reductase (NADPH)
LPLDRLSSFEGAGVYYAATQMEASACSRGSVVIVGGGNSAGQAALFLASECTEVRLVIRAETLRSSMSRYLVDQIECHPQIRVSTRSEVTGLVGEQQLDAVNLVDNSSGRGCAVQACGLFVFVGATPCTEWLHGQLAEDRHGFILTGDEVRSVAVADGYHSRGALETSRPGVFCVGDVRSRSIKRVASAVGEGSIVVRYVVDHLAAMRH